LHDDSNTVRGWVEHFAVIRKNFEAQLAAGDPEAMGPVTLGQVTLEFPRHVERIDFGESHGDVRLQVADIVAGAAAHLYAVATGARPFDAFARHLQRAGVGRLIQNEIGPVPTESTVRHLG
jgi:oxalate decarboxylase/phosphoglucose isomerase-like protein (cupin superfamily)